ncbi:hypothetical protein GGX14DRAFT_528577 [Mycena pura]|uniref:Uncharacterized protein n=1 Tax=Mycena pura TaxID=153505 RepID=A0AAD6UTV5_9AGAR|nr:hypothetical protein GGX14DRAFT_528577 [Mycena pura]
MLGLRRIISLAFVAVACASKLAARQATNTNARINPIIDSVDETLRHVGPAILTLQADHKLSTSTLATQMTALEMEFTNATKQLAAIPVSSGSTTVHPTNDDISITLADAIALVSTSLSGIIPSGAVPGFPTMVATFDPIMANMLSQFNTTLPGGITLVNTMMRDARQFLVEEGFTRTNTVLGF